MKSTFTEIQTVADLFAEKISSGVEPESLLKSSEMRGLYASIKSQKDSDKASFGQSVNELKQWIEQQAEAQKNAASQAAKPPIDITAPFDVNGTPQNRPSLLPAAHGGIHPISSELDAVLSIFERMGFTAMESRQLDDDFHMFGSLNFPEDHPARDDFDTFLTDEGLVAPAHTSTMQTRIMQQYASNLDKGLPIQSVIPGRCYRNEDIDARHEHTFYQIEGVYIDTDVTVGNLIATLKTFLEAYYQQSLEVRTQPAYFPFVEPGFEFAMSCPFCKKEGCSICSREGWIELLGCGMIHPNVLKAGGIDASKYTGFAWGMGLDRLVMMKHNIEDIRWMQSGKLEFMEQF